MRPLRIVVYCICFNERTLLPFFVKNYAFAERIVIFDDDSTDGGPDLVRSAPNVEIRRFSSGKVLSNETQRLMRDHEWKECRGQGIDYVIFVDCDEFLYANDLPKYLQESAARGITLHWASGFDMVSGTLPEQGFPIHASITRGFPNPWFSKPCVFSPDAIQEIHFTHGAHSCSAEGRILESRCAELKLLHYRFLSCEYFVKRSQVRRDRLSQADREQGLSHHYLKSDEQFREEFAAAQAASQELQLE